VDQRFQVLRCGWDINHRNVIEKEIVANEKAIFSNRVGITVIMPIPEAGDN
jgi:hypothetical protein